MITLSNGHRFEYMVASGAFGFDGKGWLWERPLVKMGLIDLSLFTIVLRTLTRNPRLYPVSNLSWARPWTWLPWSPWSCVRFLKDGGVVNKVGLYNPGIDIWREKIAPTIDFDKAHLVASIYGNQEELVEMTEMLNDFNFVGIEVNDSCPNTGHALQMTESVVQSVKAVKHVSCHPIIVKVSVAQNYCEIARQLEDVAEAISLNSVPYEIAYSSPNGQIVKKSPLHLLEKRVGGGGGGVSGKPAQKCNWLAVNQLRTQVHAMPVIGPSVMEYEDLVKVRKAGASAISFGAIHLRTPWKPTSIVRADKADQGWNGFM